MVSLWNRVFLSDITENATEISSPSSKDTLQMDLECLRGQGHSQLANEEEEKIGKCGTETDQTATPSSSGVQRFLLFLVLQEKKTLGAKNRSAYLHTVPGCVYVHVCVCA